MIKKRLHPRFRVPNFGLKSRKGVKARWRKQRGIDSKLRIKEKGYGASPSIGYKNAKEVRFTRQDGKREVLVHNEKELLAVSSEAREVAVFAHDVSARKRIALQKVASAKGIKVANSVRA